MIKYLGSKKRLLEPLLDSVCKLPGAHTALDLFSGTSRVGLALKSRGIRVVANDHNAYAATLARCYVQADYEESLVRAAIQLTNEFNRLPGAPGYFTETFCEKSRYFQPKNGARVDAIREEIARKCLPPELEAMMLTSLLEAADRVDSTVGVQMAYLKTWADRAYKDLQLSTPKLIPRSPHGKGEAYQLDALEAARLFSADMVYLDPPYNSHKYLGNYHVWESLVLWDKPEVYGVACKRVDCKTRVSDYNRISAASTLTQLIGTLKCRYIVLSYSDDGIATRAELEKALLQRGPTSFTTIDCARYVGHKIGIHDQHGRKVGTPTNSRTHEYIFVTEVRT